MFFNHITTFFFYRIPSLDDPSGFFWRSCQRQNTVALVTELKYEHVVDRLHGGKVCILPIYYSER